MHSLGEVDMRPRISTLLLATAVAAVALAACGSSSKTTSGTTSPTTTATAGGGAATVQAANVPVVGTVLVNAQGHTLYVLTSEKGDKVTCTNANGCTTVWPSTALPSGTTHAVAGSGVKTSLLGTVSASGQLRVTYAGYPLYTFSGDTASGVANGKGISSFGGTWWPISPAGTLITSSSSSSSTTTGYSGY
jgi:predicted lipoprotein with Yx(FWY)xxD motif